MTKKKPTNPFYVLLLLAGVAFAVTACAYGVMTVRQLQAGRMARRMPVDDIETSASFNQVVDEHGLTAMIAELVLLGIGTFGAIAYDQRLDAQDAKKAATESPDDHSKETST